MNNLTTKVAGIFNDSLEVIVNDINKTSHILISDNLLTNMICNYRLCSDNLKKLSLVFNASLRASQNNSNVIEAFITESKTVFQRIESIFHHSKWSTNDRVREFNVATCNTSEAKCTDDNKFYIIKCYDHFYYVYDTGSNKCLIVIKNEKKALSMVNILLLTPYLFYGDIYAVHGGLVSDGKNNILISSSSLGGKTTFALLFLENGWQIITEEATYITKYGEVLNYNIRNYLNIRVGSYLEFKKFFLKANIVNDSFLAMADIDKKELFELGKRAQMSIDFEDLCDNGSGVIADRITHVLKVSLKKGKLGMIIQEDSPIENVARFLEVSFAPTVMLFDRLTAVDNLKRKKRREELIQIFKNTKSYSVTSGFDYRRNFNFLLREIKLLKYKHN